MDLVARAHSLGKDVATGVRFFPRLPSFLLRPITVEEARATLQRRLERRGGDFLRLARRAIYEHAASPYRELLKLAGCEHGDLERLVTRDGVEEALRTLYRLGVYLSVDEFKGRHPVVRGQSTIAVSLERFPSLCRKYGTELVRRACDALLDYTERMTRAGIATIPSGVYEFEDRFDTDELPDEKTFRARIEVKGDEIFLHFDSPPQVRSGVNLVWTGLLATVYYAVKTLVGPEIPANAGLFRPIHVFAPSGTMLNCSAPAAVNSRTQTCQRVVDLIHGALARAIPERIIAACNGACVSSTFSGVHPRTGQFYVYLETIGGGFGARATKDGLDGVHVHITNTSNLPVEALEPEYPLVVERYALVEDSGGPGAWRGGLGIWRQIRAEGHDCHAFVHGTRRWSAPWGLFGGHDGGRCRFAFAPGVEPPVRAQGFLKAGQWVAIITPGAGGYGDPHRRDRALVERDVAEGKVSATVARDVYGLSNTRTDGGNL